MKIRPASISEREVQQYAKALRAPLPGHGAAPAAGAGTRDRRARRARCSRGWSIASGMTAKQFVIVDAAMNDLIRPSLYDAYHEIVPVVPGPFNAEDCEPADIVGPVCESGDFFAHDRKVPGLAEGDLVAILDAGAYGMSLASNYNTRPRAAEVLVDGKRVKLIRRRETLKDLLGPEQV